MPLHKQSARSKRSWFGLLLAFGLFCGAPVIALWACDTPVYRYAMYRWEPAPYEIYYFHAQPVSPAATALHEQIEELRDGQFVRANLYLQVVNSQDDGDLKNLPPDVREAWLAREEKPDSAYVIVNPQGQQIYTGDLAKKDLQQLIESPVRTKIHGLLQSGHAAVMVVLHGKDPAANAAAEKQVAKMIEMVNTGELNLYGGPDNLLGGPLEPSDAPPGATAETPQNSQPEEAPAEAPPAAKPAATTPATEQPAEAQDAVPADAKKIGENQSAAAVAEEDRERPPHQMAMVSIQRDDANERWFVSQLMAVESDLGTFAEEPMVFAVFGRGRVLPPYIGKGITADNLSQVAFFITGACSCTVKDQNPGVDLLTYHDWEGAAQALAEKFGVEEGNEGSIGDLLPPVLTAGVDLPDGKSPQPNDQAADTDDQPEGSEPVGSVPADSATLAQGTTTPEVPGADPPANAASGESNPPAEPAQVAMAASPTHDGGPSETAGAEDAGAASGQLMWIMGLGLLVTFGLLMAATFAFKPSR